MSIDFPCSNCGRTLRTPDNTAGRQAQCPECQAMTTVPGAAASAPPAFLPDGEGTRREEPSMSPFRPPESSREPAALNPYQSPEQSGLVDMPYGSDPFYARHRVVGPAITLIVLASINVVFWLFGILQHVVFMNKVQRHGMRDAEFVVGNIVGFAFILGISGLVLFGGIAMKNLKSYGLAMTASIFALLPCFWPCCVLSFPIGIWAIVVLNDPYVKAAFRS